MKHDLKLVQPFFNDVLTGKKKFEIRKNDRDFKIGDELILKEYIPETESYTGEVLQMVITYILDDKNYCKAGYVILGIESIWDRFSRYIQENCVNKI